MFQQLNNQPATDSCGLADHTVAPAAAAAAAAAVASFSASQPNMQQRIVSKQPPPQQHQQHASSSTIQACHLQHPTPHPCGITRTPSGGLLLSAALTPPAAATPPPLAGTVPAAATEAAPAPLAGTSKAFTPFLQVSLRGCTYVFPGRLVCSRCGAAHHTAATCRTTSCLSCKGYGHLAGSCANACRNCGRHHPSSNCKMHHCKTCHLWGELKLQMCARPCCQLS
jgi:hypothetical protein